MKYLFNVSSAYTVEAESAKEAEQKLIDNQDSYRPSWVEITLVEEGESK